MSGCGTQQQVIRTQRCLSMVSKSASHYTEHTTHEATVQRPGGQSDRRTGGQAENQPERAGQHARLVMLEAVRTSATYLDVEHSTTDRLGRGGMRVIGYQRRGWELRAG